MIIRILLLLIALLMVMMGNQFDYPFMYFLAVLFGAIALLSK